MSSKAINILVIHERQTSVVPLLKNLSDFGEIKIKAQAVSDFPKALVLLQKKKWEGLVWELGSRKKEDLSILKSLRKAAPEIPLIIVAHEPRSSARLRLLLKKGANYSVQKSAVKGSYFPETILWVLQQKKISQELARFASFPQFNPNPIVEFTPQGKVTYLNPAARKSLPRLQKESLRSPLLQGLDDLYREQISRQEFLSLSREVACGEEIYEQQINIMPQEGLIRVYMREVTLTKKLDRLKDTFIGTLSHELRTPLTIVKTAVANLLEGVAGLLSEQQTRIVTIANNNVDRLARLINDLLDLSRLESGKVLAQRIPLELSSFIDEAVKGFQISAAKKGVTIGMALKSMPLVYADGDMVTQVLVNLLSNAERFANSKIVVKSRLVEETRSSLTGTRKGSLKDRFVEISVSNDGPGVPKDQRLNLFSKFVQLNRPQGGNGYKGTGLGLSICREIVERHQGKIGVENDPQLGGARFYFTLPVYEEERVFIPVFEAKLKEAESKKAPITLLTMAIENLKDIKIQCSPEQVSHLFRDLTMRIQTEALRKADELFPYSHKEFIAILAETGRSGAETMRHRLQDVAGRLFTMGKRGPIAPKLRVDMACHPDDGLTRDAFLLKVLDEIRSPSIKEIQ